MKYIYLTLSLLFFIGCVKIDNQAKTPTYSYKIVEIDGCEYIETCNRYNTLTHKGDCKNKIHLYKKEE